ncbi:MAG: DMT family transporter [Bacillota bacterium]
MPQGYLAVIASMLIWGSVGVFARKAGQDPLVTVTYRVLIGALALGLLQLLQRFLGGVRPPLLPPGSGRAGRLALLLFSGLALAANWLFFFKAVATTTVSNAVLSYYAAPVMVALAAPLLLKERLEFKTVVATGLAVGGIFLMLYQPGQALSGSDVAGIGYGLTAAAFYATVTITGRWLSGVQATQLVLVQTLVASAVLLPVVLLSPELSAAMWSAPAGAIGLLAVIGVVHTALALVLYFYGLRHAKVQYVGVLAYLDPVSAILFALLFLGERPTAVSLLGGALVLLGSAVLLTPTGSAGAPAGAGSGRRSRTG